MPNVYILHTETLEAHPPEAWLETLPEALVRDVMAYRVEADRIRVLGGKLLLRYAMELEDSGCDLSMVREAEKGRLYVPGSAFDFNISHSGQWVVLATTFEGPCGIDIECHRQVDIHLFRRLFTDGEWEAITGAEDPRSVFFRCWAIKESVIKADGRGVAILGETEIMSHDHAVCDGKTWYIRALNIAEGYSACIAHHRPFGSEPPVSRIAANNLTALL